MTTEKLFFLIFLLFSKNIYADVTTWSTGRYANNASMQKTLFINGANSLVVNIRGETEQGYDFLKIYNSSNQLVGTYSGTLNKNVVVNSSSIKAVFTSDYSITKSGVTVRITRRGDGGTDNSNSNPRLSREKFNITYRDSNSNRGVINGTHTVNTDLGLEESQYGIVTLYRRNVGGRTYRYEFTLSARGSRDIRDIMFIALVEKGSIFKRLPIRVDDSYGRSLISRSGSGIEVRKGNGSFYTYSRSGFRDGVSNAAHAIGGFALGETSAGTPLAMFGLAKNLTGSMFHAIDSGLENILDRPVGIEAQRQKVLPSETFSDDLADINNYSAYRLIIPVPSNYTSELNGVRFSIDIEDAYSSLSNPRFYLSWINERNIDEQVVLELGTKDTGTLRSYDTYIRAASRWLQTYE